MGGPEVGEMTQRSSKGGLGMSREEKEVERNDPVLVWRWQEEEGGGRHPG